MHFYAWEKGLKTGMYYLRSRPAVDPIKFTLDVESLLRDAGSIQVAKKRKPEESNGELEGDELVKKVKPNEEA